MRKLFFLIAALSLGRIFYAQLPIQQADIKTYQEAVRAVGLQDHAHIIPIRSLTDRQFVYYSPSPAPELLRTLSLYTRIRRVGRPPSPTDSTWLIVHITQPADLQLITKNTKNKNSLILIVPDSLAAQAPSAAAIITLKQDNELTQSLAAQLIFGGFRLSADRSATDTTVFRLGYAPPEAVGLDRHILEDSIRSVIEEGIKKRAFPGAQLLVAKDGKVVYHRAFGYHTYDKKKPVTTDNIYDMASVTKVTTVLPAVMKLVGEHKFDLDAPMAKYWRPFRHSNKAHITWRQALAHNGRLKPWIAYWMNALRKHPKRNGWRFKCGTFKDHRTRKYSIHITDSLWLNKHYRRKIFRAIKKSPLNEEPGYKYSGLIFYILPTIIERITGDEFEHYLKSNFYKPLGANTLTFNPLRFYPKDRIIPTERDTFFRMQQLHGTVHDEGAAMMGGVNGNAGLFGTANDMAKLWQMYLNEGRYAGTTYIKPEVLREFIRCQYCDQGNYRGLGFDRKFIQYDPDKAAYAKEAGPRTFGHSGYTGTLVWADPDNHILFVFLSNRVYPTRLNRKLYTMNLRPRMHHAVYQARLHTKNHTSNTDNH